MAEKVIVNKSKLTALGDAIRSKTGTTASLTLDAMASEIANISAGTDTNDATATSDDILLGKTAYVNGKKITGTIETYDGANDGVIEDRLKTFIEKKGASYLFYEYKGTSVDDLISYDDTENVTSMSCMFYYCDNLQTIPELNTSKVTSMYGMFSKCINLQTVPQLDTSKVTNMSYMFRDCTKLTTTPLLDTSKVTNMSYIFNSCNKLQTIDITSMDKVNSTSYSNGMCENCNSLTKLIIRTMTVIPTLNSNAFRNCYHFTGTVNSTYNPTGAKDGRIYVPDNMVESLKSATNWSTYADIIVGLSTLVEE